jgi:hypothetical protein
MKIQRHLRRLPRTDAAYGQVDYCANVLESGIRNPVRGITSDCQRDDKAPACSGRMVVCSAIDFSSLIYYTSSACLT